MLALFYVFATLTMENEMATLINPEDDSITFEVLLESYKLALEAFAQHTASHATRPDETVVCLDCGKEKAECLYTKAKEIQNRNFFGDDYDALFGEKKDS